MRKRCTPHPEGKHDATSDNCIIKKECTLLSGSRFCAAKSLRVEKVHKSILCGMKNSLCQIMVTRLVKGVCMHCVHGGNLSLRNISYGGKKNQLATRISVQSRIKAGQCWRKGKGGRAIKPSLGAVYVRARVHVVHLLLRQRGGTQPMTVTALRDKNYVINYGRKL